MDREPDSPIIDSQDDTSSWHSAFDSPEDHPASANQSQQLDKPKTIKKAKKSKDKTKKKKTKKSKKDRKRLKKDYNYRQDAQLPGSSSFSDQSALVEDLYDPTLAPPMSSSSSLRSAPHPNRRSPACAKLLVRAGLR